jgi:hypothetical protein
MNKYYCSFIRGGKNRPLNRISQQNVKKRFWQLQKAIKNADYQHVQ